MQKDVWSKIDGIVNFKVDCLKGKTSLLDYESWAGDGEVRERSFFGCFTEGPKTGKFDKRIIDEC